MIKFLIILISFFIVLIINILVSVYIIEIYKKNKNYVLNILKRDKNFNITKLVYKKGLLDILHFNIDKKTINMLNKISNYSVNIIIISFLILFIKDIKILSLYFILIIIGLLIRLITFTVTLIPPPHLYKKTVISSIKKMLTNEEQDTQPAFDYMYSGHTFMIVLSLLFIWYYRTNSWLYKINGTILNIIVIVLTLLGIIALPSISMSRLHYTSDVIVGSLFAIFIFIIGNRFKNKL